MVKLLFQFCQFAQIDIQQKLHFLPFQTLYRLVFVCFYIISLDVCDNHSVANQQVKVTNINCLFHMFMHGVDRRMPHTLDSHSNYLFYGRHAYANCKTHTD